MKFERERLAAKRASYFDVTPVPFDVSVQTVVSHLYKINVFGAIACPTQFADGLEALQRAGEDDAVLINLQTPGGSADATDMFVQAMRECEADVHVMASGGVHSAGTIILMNADSFELSEGFSALVHNGSNGTGGKFSDYASEVVFQMKHHEALMRRTYEGFLSDEELTALLGGKDFWMDGEEFGARYVARQAYLAAKFGLVAEGGSEDA